MNEKYVFLIICCLTACSDENIDLDVVNYPIAVNFRPLLCPERGGLTSIETAQQSVLNDENNYLHHVDISHFRPEPVYPEVDFVNETVIVVNMGQKASGGFRTEITSIKEFEDSIVVEFESTNLPSISEHGFSCTANAALTSPFCMVAIPKTEKQVSFVETVFHECL